jgi:hypothetical protein
VVVAQVTEHKQGSVQRFKFAWIYSRSSSYIRISPECLPVNLKFLIHLTGERSRVRTPLSGEPFLFKRAIYVQVSHFCSGELYLFKRALSVQVNHFCSGEQYLFKRAIYVQESYFCSREPFMFRWAISVQESYICSREPFLFRWTISAQESHFCSREPFMFRRAISVQESHLCSGEPFLFRRVIFVQESHFCSGETFLLRRAISVQERLALNLRFLQVVIRTLACSTCSKSPSGLKRVSKNLLHLTVFHSNIISVNIYIYTMTHNVQSNTTKFFVVNVNQKGNMFRHFLDRHNQAF